MWNYRHIRFYSHINEERFSVFGGRARFQPEFTETHVNRVRRDPGYEVRSFRELVQFIGQLSSRNSHLNLYYRGQRTDYLTKQWHKSSGGKTKLYPSLFREPTGQQSLRRATLSKRQQYLRKVVAEVKARLPYGGLRAHDEFWLALMQHYGVARTPLLDVTQSLRVGATFALVDFETGQRRDEGFLYALHLPYPNGSITKLADESIVVAKLQSICPSQALRPHYQEGYLVGRWPLTESKEQGDNLAYRLVGKYRLRNVDNRFFDDRFEPIPADALLPSDDPFGTELQEIVTTMGPPPGVAPNGVEFDGGSSGSIMHGA